MKLYRLQDVPDLSGAMTFHLSRAMAWVPPLTGIIMLVGLTVLVQHKMLPWLILAISGPFLALFTWIFLRMAVAAYRPDNWVIRFTHQELCIKFRSYLNRHFPDDAPVVVVIPFGEIDAVRRVKEQYSAPDSEGGDHYSSGTILEITLRQPAPEALVEAMHHEATRKGPTRRWGNMRHFHTPAYLAGDRNIRVPFFDKSTLMVPRLDKALSALNQLVRIDNSGEREIKRWRKMDEPAFQAHLRELVERGERMDAIAMLQQRYGCGLAESERLLEELGDQPKDEHIGVG